VTASSDAVVLPEGAELEQLERRTLNSLRMSQVPGQAAVAGMVAVVTLLARDMLGSDRLAGAGSAAFTAGAALTMIPLAAYMRQHGRRPGLTRALSVGAVGATVAAFGGAIGVFPIFLVGMIAFGSGQAATLQQRYVAADLVPAERQATAIAAIVWIGTLGAVLGPLLTPFERAAADAVGLNELVGPFIFAALFFGVAATIVWRRLRPDPLAVIGGIDATAQRTHPIAQLRASASVIAESPGARLGLGAMALSQAAMVGVMTMTPPHMDDHGHDSLSAFVIAAHILGMYGLAPVVGRFVTRVGTGRSISYGAVVLGAGTISTVLAGYVPALMFIGLFFLGLGWNIALISGSSLLTSSVPLAARVEVQGTSDLTMSACGAMAALSSGLVKESFGFHLVADGAALLAGGILLLAWYTRARHPRSFA
jgi:MFS family permease